MIPASFACNPEGELISMVEWDEDERFHYMLDGQNTVLALTAEGSEADSPDAVYDYSPYGEQTGETIEDSPAGELNPFGYTGAYQFQDGTVHLSHRFLDTFTMNFTQADPSRQEMNNSTYAECDPINNTDPTGLVSAADQAAADELWGVICDGAAIVGGVATFSTFAVPVTAPVAGPSAAIATGVGVGCALRSQFAPAGV